MLQSNDAGIIDLGGLSGPSAYGKDYGPKGGEGCDLVDTYWTALRDKGIAIVFGPVLDPKGVWGVAVVETPDEATARALLANDPVEKAGLSKIEIYPMGPGTIVRE